MSDSISIRSLGSRIGEHVRILGWVRNHRSSGKIAFLIVRDGTGEVQVVVARHEVDDATWKAVTDRVAYETSVAVEGVVRADERSPSGVELTASRVEVLGDSSNDYPIQLKDAGVDFLLSKRHLWLRTPRQTAIMRIRDEVIKAIHDYFYDRDFVLVDTPILTGSIGESAGDSLRDGVLRPRNGLPGPDGTAVRGSGGCRARQGLLLRSDIPGGEEQDTSSPDRILDG